MPKLIYDGATFDSRAEESVLDSLTGGGVPVPHSCRSGVCQTCLMRAVRGRPPEEAQRGLKPTLKEQNYFLACSCFPTDDLEVALPDAAATRISALVHAITPLNGEIVRLELECDPPLDYQPGQFINLWRDETVGRSYSLASLPGSDPHLHLHVRRVPDGQVSGWAHRTLAPGQTVQLSGPAGNCFYTAGRPEQPLLLVGTGSGLAPLYGILRDALAQGHAGPVRLYHGSRGPEGLYLLDELRALAARHANFSYAPCLSGPAASPGYAAGRALDVALAENPRLSGWRVFLCGNPEMVNTAKKKAFLAGASMKDIYADPFTPAPA